MSFKHSSEDGYPTLTSTEQRQLETILSPHRPPPNVPKPTLQKNLHLQWLIRNFSQGFPERFIGQDASQPWLFFWTLQGFYYFGAELDPQNKQRFVILLAYTEDTGLNSTKMHRYSHGMPASRGRVWRRARPISAFIANVRRCECTCVCRSPWTRRRLGSD